MSNSHRLLELDVLRGIAATAVLFYHYTSGFNDIYGHSDKLLFYFPCGHLGVKLFFIISGFVIFMTLQRVKQAADFVVGRFSRLYPVYWTAAAITFIIVGIAGLPGREVSLKDALINLTMLEVWLKTPFIDGAYWSLCYELSFYGIMLIIYLVNGFKRIEIIAIGWLLLIFLAQVTTNYLKFQINGLLMISLLLNYGNLFIAGIMFFKIKTKQPSLTTHLIIAFCLLIELISPYTILEKIVITSLFSIFYLFAYERLYFIINRPLLFLGAISYPLYLIHQNVGYVVINTLYKLNLNPNLIILAAITVSILLGWLISISVEKPAMRAIRSKYKVMIASRTRNIVPLVEPQTISGMGLEVIEVFKGDQIAARVEKP